MTTEPEWLTYDLYINLKKACDRKSHLLPNLLSHISIQAAIAVCVYVCVCVFEQDGWLGRQIDKQVVKDRYEWMVALMNR